MILKDRELIKPFLQKKSDSCILIVQFYVHDIVFGSSNTSLCENFANLMKGEFEMSLMGELSFFLNLQIKQSDKGIFINQGKYAKELIKTFGMEKGKAFGTPMSPSTGLESDTIGKAVEVKQYRGMIGSLLYLTASRPDIKFCVYKCVRFQYAPKESHLTTLNRILRYLIGTSNMGLWYSFLRIFI